MKLIFVYFFYFLFLFYYITYAGVPASPSSSYDYDYFKTTKQNLDTKKYQQINQPRVQIIVQGNVRLDSSVIIRDANIDVNITDQKNLSLSVKRLYKTGYYENVNIFKKDNVIFISVKENPLINQVSIEGNSEISDEIIKSEISTKSRDVYSMDVIKNDVKKFNLSIKEWDFFQPL